jgi:hypothetical protein
VSGRLREIAERTGCHPLVENIASPLAIRGTLTETEFLNQIFARAGCGFVLDVAELCAHASMHGFEPAEWLDDIESQQVEQVRFSAPSGLGFDGAAGPTFDEQLHVVMPLLTRAQHTAIVLAASPYCALETVEIGLARLRSVAGGTDLAPAS